MPVPDAGGIEQSVGPDSSAVSDSRGSEGTADIHDGDSGTVRLRNAVCSAGRACAFAPSGLFNTFDRIFQPGADRLWRRVADAGTGNVDEYCRASAPVFRRSDAWFSVFSWLSKTGNSAGSVPDSGLCHGEMDMKKKGRYVVEAAFLVPGICMLLVYVVFFSLYAHDCAVCVHTALEVGIKGCYPDGHTDSQRKEDMERDLSEKLSMQLLWLQNNHVEIQVSPLRVTLKVSGTGSFLPVSGLETQQTIYRIQPCETIRRSRWMRD